MNGMKPLVAFLELLKLFGLERGSVCFVIGAEYTLVFGEEREVMNDVRLDRIFSLVFFSGYHIDPEFVAQIPLMARFVTAIE